ncbi:MAG: riboflavin synthase subunit alpha [Lysobacteraceae bacterium]|nr:MAG: riboflavin synthase subunit alpha [Xanthomonadaceae bacterium]
MFTGIVEKLGVLRARTPMGGDVRLSVDTGYEGIEVGESIAVNGVCLTALPAEAAGDATHFDVSSETLRLTSLGQLTVGGKVNLERALLPTTRLGGHLVSGHVDGLATLLTRVAEARSEQLTFEVPPELQRFIAAKGSVCLDGVSLTTNTVQGAVFSVNLVPHTLEVTTLGQLSPGDVVNLEVDVLARYLDRLMAGRE